jgi:hypothetical protein
MAHSLDLRMPTETEGVDGMVEELHGTSSPQIGSFAFPAF